MKRNTPLVFVIVILLLSNSVFGQYEGLDSTRKQTKNPIQETKFADEIVAYRYKDIKYNGLDFTAFGSGITYSMELAPYTGFHINEKFYAAVGLTGSIYADNFNNIMSPIGGVYSFARLPISNLFLHVEYRYQNSIVSFNPRERQWFGTPILGGGYNNDGRLGMYALIGVAFNPKYSYTNALGAFIYRFGIRF
jgi:hypothetical protein